MSTVSQQGAGRLQRIDLDPVTRVAGGMALRAEVDTERREVAEATIMATTFRGYEAILEGRDARDAIFVSSRACGVCGGAHAMTSALACEMTFGVAPPPMGIAARNMLSAIESLYDIPTHLFVRAGPDYSEPIVRQTNPELWSQAQRTSAPHADRHGLRRISDIMTAMGGELYREALAMARVAREAYVPIGGKFPHAQTIVPGGISSTIDPSDMNVTLLRIGRFFDYGRRVAAVWDDLTEFFYAVNPRYQEVGAGARTFLDLGQWDDPHAYDASFENAPIWGLQRWATPGVVVDGQLRTTDLHQIDAGIEEFVEHAFYDDWTAGGTDTFRTDPAGNRISERHPWNKRTLPQPGAPNLDGKHSWSTAARWDRTAMETGPGARLWITALAGRQPHTRFIEATGHGLRLHVPQAGTPASVEEWQIPTVWNAFERNRARAYALLHAALVAYENAVIGLDLMRQGSPDSDVFTAYDIPKADRVGVGYWGGARGAISHHMQIDSRVIQRYQIVAPSTFSASPPDAAGTPSPCEAAVVGTPLLCTEQHERGVDALRAVRSFDPCMVCAAH